MSTQQDIRPQPAGTSVRGRRAAAATARWWRRPIILGPAAAVLVVIALVVVAVSMSGGSKAGPTGPVDAPISLPSSVAGLKQVPDKQQFSRSTAWKARAAAVAGPATIVGRQYGSTTHSVRVVAARTDLTGKLELAWAADHGTSFGAVQCSQNLRIGGKTAQPMVRPTLMLCWRTSAQFSVYALIVDQGPLPTGRGGAAIVNQIWTGA